MGDSIFKLLSPKWLRRRKRFERVSNIGQLPEYEDTSIDQVLSASDRMTSKFDPRASLMVPRMQAGTKFRQIEQARQFQRIVEERAARTSVAAPPYEFLEFIGRGSFGRVYKCKHRENNSVVAVKITEIDAADYKAYFEEKDRSLPDLIKEIEILQQLKQSRASDYVNIIYDAFPMYTELWMVSEYCPGGSITTLMKATPQKGLEEKYIIAVARELATALMYVHEAGIIHRDVKCGNVLVTEDGRVQLCDFGVSGALESDISKRSTIVGTLHWMPPELLEASVASNYSRFPVAPLYRDEVDIWAFGCTVFEMAMGHGPMATTRSLPELASTAQEKPPRLEGDQFSESLKSLVEFCCQAKPESRPSAAEVMQHDYLRDTLEAYPTGSLSELIERYVKWETSGGSRVSLFNPQMGAAAPEALAPVADEDDQWTFSTSDNFDDHDFDFGQDFTESFLNGHASTPSDPTIKPGTSGVLNTNFAMPRSNAPRESMVRRGGAGLGRLFEPDAAPYTYGEESDLSLRQQYGSDFGNTRESIIDLDDVGGPPFGLPPLDLGDVPTLRANRGGGLNREELDRVIAQMREEEEFEAAEAARLARQNANANNQDIEPRRATRDWKFPTMGASEPNIMNRRTQDWSFSSAMAEAKIGDEEPMPSTFTAPAEDGNIRRTRDFVFPAREPDFGAPSSDDGPEISIDLASPDEFRPHLRHAATAPYGDFGTMYGNPSAANSPPRTSMIDLDFAMPDDNYMARPMTGDSGGIDTQPSSLETQGANPFDLEDQVHLSENNNRASYHTKSQSEPTQAVPGLLTPNERLSGSNQDGKTGHNRGSSQSNVTVKPVVPPPVVQPQAFNRRHQRRYPRRDVSVSQSSASFSENDTDTDYESYPIRDPNDTGELDLEDEFWTSIAKTLPAKDQAPFSSRRAPALSRSSSAASHTDYYSGTESDTPLTSERSYNFGAVPSNLSISTTTGLSVAGDLNTAPPRTSIRAPPEAFSNGQRPQVYWPVPQGPNPEALKFDAESDLVEGELDRMLGEMIHGLGVAKGVLKSRGSVIKK